MARQFVTPGVANQTLLWDRRGRPVLLFRYNTYTVWLPDGSQVEVREGDNFQTVDGLVWSLPFLSGKDRILLGVCELCRYPRSSLLQATAPTHGLCSLPNLHICTCGEPFCPRHGRECDDDIWRCTECADMWALKQSYRRIGQMLLWPFFRKEEED